MSDDAFTRIRVSEKTDDLPDLLGESANVLRLVARQSRALTALRRWLFVSALVNVVLLAVAMLAIYKIFVEAG
jgi:hypothetical protein